MALVVVLVGPPARWCVEHRLMLSGG
jgi:hypothetical protein